MIDFEIKDMTCGHCVSAITKALKGVDRNAQVQIDLATHRVRIESASANAEELAHAIREAGYSPAPAPSAATTGTGQAARSCCGCR